MNGCTGREIRTTYVLHVFFYRDNWHAFLPFFKNTFHVHVDCSRNFGEIVGWDARGHTDGDSVATVQQQIG